jgi:DNA-binding GntR family transcriptional regulator
LPEKNDTMTKTRTGKSRTATGGDAAAAAGDLGSLRLSAYEEIKRRITTLHYRPGESLNETRLSEELGIGRTPVHEAVNRLALEGMLEIFPRKGLIVKPISLDEVLEIAEARMVNEAWCASLAARRATDADLIAMREILNAMPEFIASRNIEALMNLDREFHCAISRAAKQRTLAEVLLQLHVRSLRFWFISLSEPHHIQDVLDEHLAVYQAIAERNPDKAAHLMRAHIQTYMNNITRKV